MCVFGRHVHIHTVINWSTGRRTIDARGGEGLSGRVEVGRGTRGSADLARAGTRHVDARRAISRCYRENVTFLFWQYSGSSVAAVLLFRNSDAAFDEMGPSVAMENGRSESCCGHCTLHAYTIASVCRFGEAILTFLRLIVGYNGDR